MYVNGNSLSHSGGMVQLPISIYCIGECGARSWRNWSPTFKDNCLAPEMDGASYAVN